MKLVDKMVLFSRFLRENNKHKIDLKDSLENHKAYFDEQSRYWKNKSSYEYIDSTLTHLISLLDIYNTSISQIDKKISDLLRNEEVHVIRRDYDLYNQTENTLDLKLERHNSDKDWLKTIGTEIGNYTEWKYGGIDLNPTNGIHTRCLLACDPLYLYSGNIIDIDAVKNRFNRFYATKRLMFYDKFEDLPKSQLGTAVSINQYEFMPIDPIKDEMKKVYNILRPGGYFIFTYSDCELETQLDFLSGPGPYLAYNTKTLMISMIEMLGFDFVKSDSWRDAQSWMIVQKPGNLETIKLGAPVVIVQEK